MHPPKYNDLFEQRVENINVLKDTVSVHIKIVLHISNNKLPPIKAGWKGSFLTSLLYSSVVLGKIDVRLNPRWCCQRMISHIETIRGSLRC